MTASGTYSWSISNGELIQLAYSRCGVRRPGLRQEHMLNARQELNLLQVEWSNRQVNLWRVELLSQTLDGSTTFTLPSRVIVMLDAYVSTDYGTSNQTDRIIIPISRSDYASYSSKSTSGPPTVYFFNRQITPTVTLYPVAAASDSLTLSYYAATQIQDATVPGGVTPDVPYRWLDAMCAGLAFRLSDHYSPDRSNMLEKRYDKAWGFAAGQDIEKANVKIRPNMSRYFR